MTLSGEFVYSTHAIDYRITILQKLSFPSVAVNPEGCKVMLATIGSDPDPLKIPFFEQYLYANIDDYYQSHRQEIKSLISHQYPSVCNCCADTIAERMRRLLESVNEHHKCLGGRFTSIYIVHVQIEPSRDSSLPRSKLATVESVSKLISDKEFEKDEESRWSAEEHDECVICTDEIKTWMSSLKMPCFHVFHQRCLVRWLKTSHVCPLCRHELPHCEG